MIPAPTILFTKLDEAPNTPDNCLGDESFAVEVGEVVLSASKFAAIADCELEKENDRDAAESS